MAWCHRTMLAYWKFESISLQQRVREPSVPPHDMMWGPQAALIAECSSRACATTAFFCNFGAPNAVSRQVPRYQQLRQSAAGTSPAWPIPGGWRLSFARAGVSVSARGIMLMSS